MTILSTEKLSHNALGLLQSAGWFPERCGFGATHCARLRDTKYPAGARAERILDELGGITVQKQNAEPRQGRDEHTPSSTIFHNLVKRISDSLSYMGFAGSSERAQVFAPVSDQPLLSFDSDHLLRFAADQEVILNCVGFTIGHIVSVVGCTWYDVTLLIDESNEMAYTYDSIAENVTWFATLEDAVSVLLWTGGNRLQTKPLVIPPDDFEWSREQQQQFGIA